MSISTARTARPVAVPPLDLNAAAERLGVSPRYMRRLVADRRIRHYKVGHFLRFDVADLDAFLAASVREPVAT